MSTSPAVTLTAQCPHTHNSRYPHHPLGLHQSYTYHTQRPPTVRFCSPPGGRYIGPPRQRVTRCVISRLILYQCHHCTNYIYTNCTNKSSYLTLAHCSINESFQSGKVRYRSRHARLICHVMEKNLRKLVVFHLFTHICCNLDRYSHSLTSHTSISYVTIFISTEKYNITNMCSACIAQNHLHNGVSRIL